ncbi:apoptotic chromatin condensation inducer in the nucleus-like isoform X1 [Schistocerca americana]|uniref:apoptotic chromatin condensation inducer in the nucleus-like isoform X1 n=1 Tax=Schistocerca americana TaxID=7009 RepID=UPI001F4F3DB7|nr:apoptotic chromatin condensation inducer in the nucleus-like isoform X1 [Schistocerca americana]XP_046990848.1 apoptotic chromatin condensation inducer in the nucleus-like isoform X1 [Schistocerca americana]
MRRKSDKLKEKDRESPEKKTVRRSSRRHSKRRKHSHSSSPEAEDSGADDSESQCRSRSLKPDEKQEDNTVSNELNETIKSGQKKTDPGKNTEKNLTGCEEDWKEDTAFWSEDNPQGLLPKETTEPIQKKLPTTEVMDTDEGSQSQQSLPETGRGVVLEPKTRRTKRIRRRSTASGCEDGEPAADRATCDEIAASSAVESEEQRGRTESESDNGTEVTVSKRDRVASDCAQGSNVSEAKGSEVKLNENSSEQGRRNSVDNRSEQEDPAEEKLSVGLNSEVVKKEKTIEEKIADMCNDSSCDKSETDCDNNSRKDISEGMTKEKVLELLGDDSSAVQSSLKLESDRETSDESTVQQDAIKDDSSASRASSETPSKESAVPRRRSSSDSADFQSNREEGGRDSSEGVKMELSDEKNALLKETVSSSDKQQPEADDSAKETDSVHEKNSQKTDKHVEKLHEAGNSSAKNESGSSDQPKTEEVKVKPKRIKLCRTSRDTNSYSAASKDTRSHSPDSHENQRPVKLNRKSRSPEPSQKSRRRESDSQEPRSPGQRYERIILRRSFSEKSVSRIEGDTGTVSRAKTDIATDCKDNKENEKLVSNKADAAEAAAGSISRKRRWGASKTSRANKKPVLSISSDSLKNLIPGAKPLSAGEVQLTEDDNCKDTKIEVEESWSAKVTEVKELMRPLAVMPDTSRPTTSAADDHNRFAVRKISIVSDDARTLQRSPSPPKNKVSDILFITNLVRPFTVHQLKELLARTGTIVEDGFWIDKIKSKCFVQYETEDQARETRHALHGIRWPVSNPKQLCVDFGRREDMEAAKAAGETDSVVRKTDPLQVERVPPVSLPVQGGNIPLVENWVASQQQRDKERDRERERERDRGRVKERGAAPPEQRTQKVPPAVREWDLGKIGQMSPERDSRSEERTKDRERKSRKDKPHRSRSTSPSDISARKSKKKEDDAPAKLLDDLFRKTKTAPCIYWLPLTAEQIVVKEEMRRKHMAEHERRMAEMRKAERERERERARAQQRPHRRSGGGAGDRDRDRERDRRSGRRRSASGSPKK